MMLGKHAAIQCSREGWVDAACSRYDCIQPDVSADSCCWWPVQLLSWTVRWRHIVYVLLSVCGLVPCSILGSGLVSSLKAQAA